MLIASVRQLFALFFVTVLSGACTPLRLFPTRVLENVRELASEDGRSGSNLIDDRIDVVVRVPHQGLHMANSDDESRTFSSFELPAAPVGMSEADATAFYESFYEGLHEANGTTFIHRVDDIGVSLVSALDHHLRRYFREVNVTVDKGPGFVVEIQGSSRWALSKVADLGITTVSGPVSIGLMEGHASRSAAGHFGWTIPVTLILGVVLGYGIVSAIMPGVHARHYRSVLARALHEASANWAQEAAIAYQRNGGFVRATPPPVRTLVQP